MNLVFLHGLFGSPQNWDESIKYMFSGGEFTTIQMPIDNSVRRDPKSFGGIPSLTQFLERYLDEHEIREVVLCGNSLGGQVAIDFAAKNPHKIGGLILTGSAGLYEKSLNASNAKVQQGRDAVAQLASGIFYDKSKCTDEIVQHAYEMLQDKQYTRFLIRVAKATRDYDVHYLLPHIKCQTALIWGKQDEITPPEVAMQFEQRIEKSRLWWIDNCGHSPPLERPVKFAEAVNEFMWGIDAWTGYF